MLAAVASRIVALSPKLATTRWRHTTTLANVERAFRSLKTIDLKVRPIHQRLADRVRTHIFLCMLACYVEWHLREAWRELMFADTDHQAKTARDPVAPAKRSQAAPAKVARHTLDDDTPAHSFATLLTELGTIVRNACRTPQAGPDAPTFEVTATPNPKQKRALELLQQIPLQAESRTPFPNQALEQQNKLFLRLRVRLPVFPRICAVIEILQCLKKYGQRLDLEIAKETGVPLSTVRRRLAGLAATKEVIMCNLTRFENGKRIDAWQCRVSGYAPPVAPGRKAKPKT